MDVLFLRNIKKNFKIYRNNNTDLRKTIFKNILNE